MAIIIGIIIKFTRSYFQQSSLNGCNQHITLGVPVWATDMSYHCDHVTVILRVNQSRIIVVTLGSSSFLPCNSRLHTSTTSSTETGSRPYPLLQAVWDCGISDLRWCSAMWCGGVLEVFSSPLEGELTGSSWHLWHIRAMCPKLVRRRDWTIAVSLGCPVSLQTSSFRTNWSNLIPSSIRRQHWSKASIFRASVLETAQQSDQIGA